MSTENPFGAPLLADPGDQGYAPEPKVTAAERLLYGDLAGAVRRLGDAAVSAEEAYSLTCKWAVEHESEFVGTAESRVALSEGVQVTYQLFENAQATFREVAAKAAEIQRQRAFPQTGSDPAGDAKIRAAAP